MDMCPICGRYVDEDEWNLHAEWYGCKIPHHEDEFEKIENRFVDAECAARRIVWDTNQYKSWRDRASNSQTWKNSRKSASHQWARHKSSSHSSYETMGEKLSVEYVEFHEWIEEERDEIALLIAEEIERGELEGDQDMRDFDDDIYNRYENEVPQCFCVDCDKPVYWSHFDEDDGYYWHRSFSSVPRSQYETLYFDGVFVSDRCVEDFGDSVDDDWLTAVLHSDPFSIAPPHFCPSSGFLMEPINKDDIDHDMVGKFSSRQLSRAELKRAEIIEDMREDRDHCGHRSEMGSWKRQVRNALKQWARHEYRINPEDATTILNLVWDNRDRQLHDYIANNTVRRGRIKLPEQLAA